MAALGARRGVFNSVFTSQSYTPVNHSDWPNDQAQWDRSWRIVTEALNLPPMPTARALDTFSLPPTDPALDEALKDLLHHATWLPQARQTPDVIIWYTNHVRRHYLNQVFPNIQRLQTMLGLDKPPSPDMWVNHCIRVLEDAHRLYAEGLGILIRSLADARAVVMNFRLNLSTIVSNSIPDRECIRVVIRRHLAKILKYSDPETDFLQLVKSLNDVGLGGEKFQILFAEVMNEIMREYVSLVCGETWNLPLATGLGILPKAAHHTFPSESTTDLCKWIEDRYAKVAVQVFDILDQSPGVKVSWSQVDRWKEMSLGYLAALRTDELFDIVSQWPNAKGGLSDLRTAITTPQRRLQLTEVFTTKLNDRLLHPGASTLQILRTYILMIQSFHFLDQSDVLLSRVAFPLQLYLCSREDTVRIIISGLLSETVDAEGKSTKQGGDKLVELALLLNEGSGMGRADDEELDWHDLEWMPDPVDAGPGYKRSKNVDIIGTLIHFLGSQDIFIKEFQNIIAENLLKHDGAFEKEIKVLDLLKARFGEAPLQSCEVMLKDIQDSGRVNANIRHNQQLDMSNETVNPEGTALNAKILSRLFWPQLQDECFEVPGIITDLQGRYEQGFESLKSARKLTWLPALGQATVELELADRTIVEEVLPWQASVIFAFQDDDGDQTRSVEQLVLSCKMEEKLVRSALKFWSNKLVLQEVSKDVFTVLESLNQEERERSNAQAAGSAKNTDEPQIPTHGIAAEKRQMYWQFIQAMLTNSSSQMPLQQIVMMLKMLMEGGFPYSNEELQEFLGMKVQSGELDVVGGKYRLKK